MSFQPNMHVPVIEALAPDRIRVSVFAIGSTDATDRAKRAARAAGHKIRGVAAIGGGTSGSKSHEFWDVDLEVRPGA